MHEKSTSLLPGCVMHFWRSRTAADVGRQRPGTACERSRLQPHHRCCALQLPLRRVATCTQQKQVSRPSVRPCCMDYLGWPPRFFDVDRHQVLHATLGFAKGAGVHMGDLAVTWLTQRLRSSKRPITAPSTRALPGLWMPAEAKTSHGVYCYELNSSLRPYSGHQTLKRLM